MYISCSLLFLKVLGDQIFLNLAGLYWDVTLLDVLSNFLNSSVMAVLMHPIQHLVYLISGHLSQCVGTVSFIHITPLVCENQVETQHVFISTGLEKELRSHLLMKESVNVLVQQMLVFLSGGSQNKCMKSRHMSMQRKTGWPMGEVLLQISSKYLGTCKALIGEAWKQ